MVQMVPPVFDRQHQYPSRTIPQNVEVQLFAWKYEYSSGCTDTCAEKLVFVWCQIIILMRKFLNTACFWNIHISVFFKSLNWCIWHVTYNICFALSRFFKLLDFLPCACLETAADYASRYDCDSIRLNVSRTQLDDLHVRHRSSLEIPENNVVSACETEWRLMSDNSTNQYLIK